MPDLVKHLIGLKNIGLYVAPDHAKIKPMQIPENIELIELLTSGEVFFDVDGEEKTFGKGAIFWHKAGDYTIHRTTPQNPYRCAVFAFIVDKCLPPAPRVSLWNSEYEIDMFVSECINLFHSKKLDENALALYIYGTLLRHSLIDDNSSKHQHYPAPLERAMACIADNLGRKISIEKLSKNSGVSQPHLFKLFQTHLRTSPHQYILSQQLLRAKTLLAGTTISIKAVADECGFENIEVFYRRFSRENGISPGRYRNAHLPYQFPNAAAAEK